MSKQPSKVNWERYDTINFIADQEVLVSNTRDYVNRAYDYCRENNVDNPSAIISCAVMTAAWVYSNMGYALSKGIIPDILGLKEYEPNPNSVIHLSKKYQDMSHDDLLACVIEAFYEG